VDSDGPVFHTKLGRTGLLGWPQILWDGHTASVGGSGFSNNSLIMFLSFSFKRQGRV
jgi:hypothetical protein